MEFKLNEKQASLLKVWKDDIKRTNGEYGVFTYTFTPFGMGTSVNVKSLLTGKELDISFTEDW